MAVPNPEAYVAAHRAQATETLKRQILHDLCLLSLGFSADPRDTAQTIAKKTLDLYEELARIVDEKVGR